MHRHFTMQIALIVPPVFSGLYVCEQVTLEHVGNFIAQLFAKMEGVQ